VNINNKYIQDDVFVCSYIGTIGMAHGLDVIIRAAKRLKKMPNTQVLFLIVGDGALKKKLENEAKESKLNNIYFTGLVPKSEIPRIIYFSDAALIHLRNAQLFATVMPSKMFELMAMDVPIIMGVKGEARDILVEAKAGETMEPENELELLNAISTIRKNGRNYYKGRDYVSKYYDRNILAQNMLNIILSSVKNR
jgi:glycosyltransferase involved in cell wall biosynthesis